MLRIKILLSCLLLLPFVSFAGEIELEATRIGADLYKIVSEEIFIETEYCFETADNDKVILTLEDGDVSSLTFVKAGVRCDALMAYGRTQMDPGTFPVTVKWTHDDWYAFTDQEAAFWTSGCLSLVEEAEAQVTINEQGPGRLVLPAVDEECSIEGVYARTQLSLEEKKKEE